VILFIQERAIFAAACYESPCCFRELSSSLERSSFRSTARSFTSRNALTGGGRHAHRRTGRANCSRKDRDRRTARARLIPFPLVLVLAAKHLMYSVRWRFPVSPRTARARRNTRHCVCRTRTSSVALKSMHLSERMPTTRVETHVRVRHILEQWDPVKDDGIHGHSSIPLFAFRAEGKKERKKEDFRWLLSRACASRSERARFERRVSLKRIRQSRTRMSDERFRFRCSLQHPRNEIRSQARRTSLDRRRQLVLFRASQPTVTLRKRKSPDRTFPRFGIAFGPRIEFLPLALRISRLVTAPAIASNRESCWACTFARESRLTCRSHACDRSTIRVFVNSI